MTHSANHQTPSWVGRTTGRPRVVVLGSGERPTVQDHVARVRSVIAEQVDIALEDFQFHADLSQIEADFAVVLGGDGSILRAAKQMGPNQIPVLGVNLGRLGFLADVSLDELAQCFREVVRGQCHVVEHLMYQCTILQDNVVLSRHLGLNEVAVLGGLPYSMLYIDLYVDTDLVATYSCDGLIISTPVGSTAHSLSAGGPILRKNLQAFVISPISPHTLTMRPVVDAADRTYEIVVRQPNASTSVVVDGEAICPMTDRHRVRVERAQPRFRMVEIPNRNYYRTLREKLGWGQNLQHRDS